MRQILAPVATLALLLAAPRFADALIVGPSIDSFHFTDGAFTASNEWAGRDSIFSTAFPVVGNTGGATLYVEGSPTTLYLMYDYYNSPNVGPLNHVTISFDSTESDGITRTTYAVDMTPGLNLFQAYEKPADAFAPEVNGSFNLLLSPWTLLSSGDLSQAQFLTALNPLGTSLGHPSPHFIAEFQLSSRTQIPGGNPSGIYSPDPNFWSGLAAGDIFDPPFSSEIFTLNPDGSVLSTVPALGPNGGPVLQSQDAATPEPASATLAALAGLSLLGLGLRRRRTTSV